MEKNRKKWAKGSITGMSKTPGGTQSKDAPGEVCDELTTSLLSREHSTPAPTHPQLLYSLVRSASAQTHAAPQLSVCQHLVTHCALFKQHLFEISSFTYICNRAPAFLLLHVCSVTLGQDASYLGAPFIHSLVLCLKWSVPSSSCTNPMCDGTWVQKQTYTRGLVFDEGATVNRWC